MNSNKKTLTAILILLVMCTGISISYAFFKVASSNNNANSTVTINGAALCMSLQLSSDNITISNEYAVPISDSKALSSNTYKTSVTITNNCNTSQSFNLLLVPNSSNTMPIKALKYALVEEEVIPTSGTLISNEYILDSTIQKQLLSIKNETLKNGFSVGSGTVSSGTKTYNLYLWIDKDEGSLGNGSTMNKSLNAYLTLGSGSVIGEEIISKSFDTVFVANNIDIFEEKGIRYEGADPKNYICLDSNKEGACSSSSLLFRIIGLFDEEYSSDGTTSAGTKKLLKILDTNYYGGTNGKSWNQTQTSGKNLNDWSTATLKTELNGPYLSTLLATSGVNSKLENSIVISKWHLGGANTTYESNYNKDTITTENWYKAERSPYATSGTLQNLYSGNPEYVFAQVGLMYPSDYGYATVGGSTTNKAGCRAQALLNWDNSSFSDCKNNDWVFKSAPFIYDSEYEWLITPFSSGSNHAYYLYSTGIVGPSFYFSVGSQFDVRPTFYLDSSILKIVGGLGTKDNAYRIG